MAARVTDVHFSLQGGLKMAQDTGWIFSPYLRHVENNFYIRRSDVDIRISPRDFMGELVIYN